MSVPGQKHNTIIHLFRRVKFALRPDVASCLAILSPAWLKTPPWMNDAYHTTTGNTDSLVYNPHATVSKQLLICQIYESRCVTQTNQSEPG